MSLCGRCPHCGYRNDCQESVCQACNNEMYENDSEELTHATKTVSEESDR